MLERSPCAGGLIGPCLPSPAKAPPSSPVWLHEIKHDGFRLIARRNAKSVRLYTRNGNDFSKRFPLVVAALAALPVRSCLIDGEAIVSDDSGLAVFELIRSFRHDAVAVLCVFDLLELDGEDLRRLPIEECKARLARLLPKPLQGIALNEYFAGDGNMVFAHACKLGCEGIVSKRIGSPYRASSTGSRSRTRRFRRCGAKPRKIGVRSGAGRTIMSAPVVAVLTFLSALGAAFLGLQ